MAEFPTTTASYCVSPSAVLIPIPALAISGNMANLTTVVATGGT